MLYRQFRGKIEPSFQNIMKYDFLYVREGTGCRDEGVDCIRRKTECSGFKEFRVVGKCETDNLCHSIGVQEGDICRPYLFRCSKKSTKTFLCQGKVPWGRMCFSPAKPWQTQDGQPSNRQQWKPLWRRRK